MDSLLSIYETSRYHHTYHYKIIKNNKIKSIFNTKKNIRRQDLDKTYFIDGSLYILNVKFFLQNKVLTSKNSIGYKVKKIKSFEVDDVIDYEIIKFLKKNEKNFNKGLALYKKTSKIIPGGVQLLSKRPELFLPDQWPSYYKSAKGCEIISYDNIKLYDFTNCSVGMCPLGYANSTINKSVVRAIKRGNTTTLNTYMEYDCAKLLIKTHSWADMARFTKSGGEAMSVAVRIARSFTKKEKVLFCGYHGWHDWYISANLKNTNKLNEHLLPGISSSGIPKSLGGLTQPFEFNNTKDFKKKFKNIIKI